MVVSKAGSYERLGNTFYHFDAVKVMVIVTNPVPGLLALCKNPTKNTPLYRVPLFAVCPNRTRAVP